MARASSADAKAFQPATSRLGLAALWMGATIAFVLLATGNSGGYRFGVGDQAFYIPAILDALHPELFPRDGLVFGPQARLLPFDELTASVMAATGLSIQTIFAALYVLTLVLILAGVWGIGQAFYQHPSSGVALAAALTLRHAIARGAVNTLEGYTHPRMLVFGLGAVALAAWLRGRARVALAIAIASLLVHPTTAVFFLIWIGVAAAVDEAQMRRWLLPMAAVGAAIGVALLVNPPNGAPRVMDEAWIAVFSGKSYLFPATWPADMLLLQLAYPVVILGIYRWRVRLGMAVARERGLVAGVLTLVGLCLLALPLVAAHFSFAVQVQPSRVLWMADLMATVYLIWLVAESPWVARTQARGLAPMLVAALLVLSSAARATYLMLVTYPARTLVQADLPHTPWTEALGWVRTHTPVDTHLLLDPQHIWAAGASGRVVAVRDILLENDTDAAMAFYSRDLAMRIAERRAAVGRFEALDEERTLALARRYDLHYLVSTAALALPVAFQSGEVRVYALQPPG